MHLKHLVEMHLFSHIAKSVDILGLSLAHAVRARPAARPGARRGLATLGWGRPGLAWPLARLGLAWPGQAWPERHIVPWWWAVDECTK